MTIHDTHPFADPPSSREPGRRLRGRLTGTVSLWTAAGGGPGGGAGGGTGDRGWAGLTVSSWLVVASEETRLVAMLDPDSDLLAAVEESGRAVVQLLTWRTRDLADKFAGVAPAPGGLFAQADFTATDWGPRLTAATTWAGVRLESSAPLGWSTQVVTVAESITVGEDDALEHRRGRYRRPLGPGQG